MKYAIIDTETSGLFDFSKPADADGQPRLAHLAMILVKDEPTVEHLLEFYVKPDGWEIGAEVSALNGLTTEKLLQIGKPLSEAVEAYAKIIDDGYVIVAFNAQYDTKVMRGEMRRLNVDDRFERTRNICVMRALINICQIPKKKGGGYKFPKLGVKLQELGALPEPAVHYAKNPPADKAVSQ